MIMQLLKEQTSTLHNQVEKAAFAKQIMDGSLTLAQYQHLIIKNYQLHKMVESQIARQLTPEEQGKLQFEKRQKLHLLAKDLEGLGLDPTALLVQDDNDFAIQNIYEAIGAMYILEGSTLGGAVIQRHLAKNPAIGGEVAFHYYGCYGKETGEMWKQFAMFATMAVVTPETQEMVLQKAIETFSLFEYLLGQVDEQVTA
jgi:heme oxygenase